MVGSVHEVADLIGIILSVPTLLAISSGIYFISRIRHSADTTSKSLDDLNDRLTSIIHDHEERLRAAEQDLAILMDRRHHHHHTSD